VDHQGKRILKTGSNLGTMQMAGNASTYKQGSFIIDQGRRKRTFKSRKEGLIETRVEG
jgi:hypothetical protein